MAATFAVSTTVAPGASVTKGLLALTSGAFQPFRLVYLDLFMDGGSNQYWPKLQLVRGTGSFTAPTGGTSLTAYPGNGSGIISSSSVTAKSGTFTAELAAGTGTLQTLKNWYLPNQGGLSLPWPLGREIEAGASQILYLQVVTPASFANNISVNAEWEE